MISYELSKEQGQTFIEDTMDAETETLPLNLRCYTGYQIHYCLKCVRISMSRYEVVTVGSGK